METTFLTELLALSIVTAGLATLLGLLSHGGLGALFLGLPAGLACGLSLGGFELYGRTGLLIGVLLAALGGYSLGNMFGKRRGGLFVALLWLGYCAACAVGYLAADWRGWLTITLPSVALFWYSLWRFSGRLLPIERESWWLLRDLWRRMFDRRPLDDDEQRQRRQRYQSFRSLLTFTAGTNYPYYVVEHGKPQERVGGNPFGRLFAGPGIIITNPHEVAVVTDGMEIKETSPPGLVFTGKFDRVDQIVDLRTQLKVFDVEALTKDGIRIQVPTFVIFKINAASQRVGEFWVDGDGDEGSGGAIFQAVRASLVEESKRQSWEDLPSTVATPILRDIISEYECDDLCARDLPSWHPHEDIPFEVIKRELASRLGVAMAERCGGVQIIAASIGNLMPIDSSVMRQRIDNWRTEWERMMMIQKGEGATEALRLISQARAQGQAEVIHILTQEAEHLEDVDKDVLADVLILRLLEALDDMARRPSVQPLLSPEATEMMERLRRTAEESSSTLPQ